MSTIGKTIQDNGVAESMRCDYDFMEFMNLDDDERLDRTLLDACIMAENANKQTEKQLQSTTDVKGGDKHEGSAINQKDWIVDENNDEPVEGKLSIKMEISCSQERLIEPNMDYTLDDVVEIYSISDEDDNESEKDVVCLEANKSITSQTNALNDEDDNEDLLTVFNDHNYMSQEITTPAPDVNNDLRQNIIDHIVKKRSLEANNSASGICVDEDSCNSSNESTVDYNSQKEIEDFVDKILEGNIKNFVKKEIKSEAIHTEDFVQNVINAVADEDAAEYAAEETLANRKQKAMPEKVSQTEVQKCTPNISNEGQSHSAEGYHADDQSHDGTETCSFQSCSEHDGETKETENSISKEQQSNSVLHMEVSDNENCQRSANTSTTDTISDSINNENDDRSQLGSNATLPEYCSEPLEVIPLDERFEMAIEEEIEIPFGEDVEQNEASFLDNLLEQFENDAQHVEIPTSDVLPQLKLNIPVDDGPAENTREGIENYKSDAEITPLGVPEEEIDKNPQSPKGVEDLGSSLTHDISTDKTVLDTNKNLVEDEDQQHDTELESSLGANFERLDKAMEEAETLCRKSSILQEFTALVKEMHDDCEKFSVAATNIDSRLGAYITDKFEIMRELVRRCNCSFPVTERACQTEPTLSRRRLRKLNKKDKKALLASTDSSSCVGSSSSDGHISSSSDEIEKPSTSIRLHTSLPTSKKSIESEETKNEVAEKKLVEPDLGEIAFSQLSQVSTVISEGVYDDGVVLSKYLLSDVFSAPIVKMGDDKNSDSSTPTRKQNSLSTPTSDDDTPISKENPSHGTEKTKQKANKKEAADENDKEIERLINLDGLMKRHNNAGTSKQVDIDKQKTKSQNQKNKTDGVLEFLENDLAKESLSSDESAKENEEEVITEKQYLERYNQDLKKQLLSDSSNDTSQDEEADDEFAPALSDESESGNRSPLVDKFLKTYNIDDSEEEDVEMASEEIPAKDTSATISINDGAKIPDDGQTALKKEENQEKVVAKTSDNSDCELLNDNFIHRKRTQPKSLEKILSEAEKRKKLQKLDEDLISLSSESDCSDVEAVEMEPAEIAKSRAIKPMLRPDQLQRETVKAQKSEVERIRRLEKKQALLARVLTENKDLNTDEELVLDYNEETKTFIKVHSELVKHLKPHQRDGVRFMYDSCYGGVDSAKKNNGSGCILAHCMGLGKTLQLIALMHTVISYKELKTHKILVLCPKSTVMNWGDEIARWLYPLRTRNLKVYAFNDTSDINEKLSIMRDWSQSTYQKAGCLLIGYEAFRTLVFYHTYKNRNNLDTTRLEKIRNLIDEYLLQPGADLVVCDEGHIIKNSKSAISLAVAEIKTQKRIVLTGTPIQNNLKEYYSMVNFIKPLFLGTEKEFANLYANPIKNGQHKDSNKRDIKVMKQRSFVLHKKLSKFVQRKEAELLKSFLPKKFEYVLFIPMTNVQNKLYERILEAITGREDNRGRGLITDYTCLRKIWTHPKVLEDAWKNAIHQKFKRDARKQANSDDDQPDDIYDSQTGIMSVQNDWWRNLIDAKDLESILPSNKLRTMFEILRMCEENGDKCLIFSAFVAVLNVVEYFFKKLAEGNNETVNELNISQGLRSTWESNKDYFRLDGKTPKSTRHEMIKRFNHPNNTRARVFLISAKAGGQGINLIGANRVIILDTSWNPSNDQQNIFRIFRLGQKKNCYIYRLLALGTMEEKVYSRSVTKQAMSFRVMDVQQIDRHYSMAELAELYTLTIPNYAERPTPIFPQDTILANLLRSFPDLVYKYHEHDSLLENKIEQELSEQEKIDAWNAYENDLQMNSQMANMEDMQNKMAQGNMQNYMGASGSIPGLNLQALLNFRNMNAQTNSPYINPSLLQQYKYNMANQQYLDMVNNYRQYSTPEGAAAFNASVAAAYSSINSSMYPGGTPSVSPHLSTSANLSSNAATHPLSALNDLSMFGLGINSGTSAATAAAVAVGTSLAQLPSTPTNSSSLYATSGMPTQPVSAAGLYSNPTASFYQTLQQLGYVGAPTAAANMLNNPALNSFTNNSGSFQAPRQTPPQSASRKSSTPDLTGYRNSGGGVNMPTAPPTTSTMSLSTTPMVSMATMPNELPKLSNINNNVNSNSNSNSNINVNSKSSNDLMNSNSRRTDGVSNRVNMKPKSSSSNSSISNPNKNTTTRTETNNTVSQNRQMITPSSVSSVTSKSKTSTTTSKYLPSMTPSKQPTSNITPTTTTKTADPQIRVKDMGQLCANLNRGSSLPTAAAAVARESSANNANNSTVGRNKQSGIENKITTPTSASATELLKARSEMQIIPTTSPPGTASISKQLSEISPSISLTAVRNNNVKSSSTNSGNFPKTSGVNTSTVNSSKSSRVNSPATITSSMFTNRQQNAALNVQSKKNITNMNAVGLSHSNLTVNTKKAVISNFATAKKSSTAVLPTKKTSAPTPQSSLTMTTATNSLNTTSNIGTKATITGHGKNSSNNNVQYISESAPRANLATNAPTRITPSSSIKNTPSILRSHHIRKMPPPLPTTSGSTSNVISNTSMNASTNSNQSSSIVTKPMPTPSNNTKTSVPATVANTAQLLYNNKINTTARRSFSPTTTLTQRTSRTASPANTSTVFMEKVVSNNSNKINTTIVPTSTTSAGTIAFPVHLKRSNSALGTMRPLSALTTLKTSVKGLGNRTKSSTSIVTPRIASVASLNVSTVSTPTTSVMSSLTPAAAAMRVAALKRLTTNNSKVNLQTTKQLQSSSAMKIAAATSVVHQKRPSPSGTLGSTTTMQSQQQPPKQRISVQSNGSHVNVSVAPTRTIQGDTRIGGLNVRPILKGVTMSSNSTGALQTVDKGNAGGSQVSSASGQAVEKLLLERKRKISDTTYKEGGSLSKRPKDS